MNLNVQMLVFQIPAIMLAMIIHEYVKAMISIRLGDDTSKQRERLTLNPMKQVEPIGFLCMLIFGYGWTRPADVNPNYYSDRKKGTLIVHILPILVNLLVGVVCAIGTSIYQRYAITTGISIAFIYLHYFLVFTARFNINLALSNMIPVYPMDAWKIMLTLLEPNRRVIISGYEKIFQLIFAILLFTGILNLILGPISNAILNF